MQGSLSLNYSSIQLLLYTNWENRNGAGGMKVGREREKRRPNNDDEDEDDNK